VTGRDSGAWAAKHTAKALLGYILDSQLTGFAHAQETAAVPSPWDAWWACYRARLPAAAAGI
jgi:hypothetical protein